MAQNATPIMSTSSMPPLVPPSSANLVSVPNGMSMPPSIAQAPRSANLYHTQYSGPVPPSLPQALNSTSLTPGVPLPPPSMPQALSSTSLTGGPQLPSPPAMMQTTQTGAALLPEVVGVPVALGPSQPFQRSHTGTVLLPEATAGIPVAFETQPFVQRSQTGTVLIPEAGGGHVALGLPPERPQTMLPQAPSRNEDRGQIVTLAGDEDPLLDTANMPGRGEFYGATGRPLDDTTTNYMYPPKEDWHENVQEDRSISQSMNGKKYRYGFYNSSTTRHCGMLSFYILLPWLIFTTVAISLVFAYHRYVMSVWCVVLMFLAFAVFFAVLGVTHRRQGQKFAILGALCAFATFVGCLVGLWEYHNIAAQYWLTEESTTYTNVLPGEPAIGHADAGTLIFSVDSRVDLGKVVGFKSNGVVYCVAPIIRQEWLQGETLSSRVEYWAAGTDCCRARTSFTCGNAWDRNARVGLVMPEALPSKSWLFPGSREQYLKAAEEAAGVYGLLLGEEPLFTTWVSNVPETREEMWHKMFIFVFIASGLYFVFASVCGAIAYFVTHYRPSQRKRTDEEIPGVSQEKELD